MKTPPLKDNILGPSADGIDMKDILSKNCEFGDGISIVTCGGETTFVRDVVVRFCPITGGMGRIPNVAPGTQFSISKATPRRHGRSSGSRSAASAGSSARFRP